MINMRCFPQQFRCYRHPLLRMHIRHGPPDANVKEITEAACFFRRSIREGPLLAHSGLERTRLPHRKMSANDPKRT